MVVVPSPYAEFTVKHGTFTKQMEDKTVGYNDKQDT